MNTDIEAPTPSLLAMSIAEVIAATDAVAKTGRNNHQGYAYATEADLIQTVRAEMASRGLVMLATHEEVTELRQGLYQVAVTWTLIHAPSGQSLTIMSHGHGQDKQDKAVYKARTGAMKYALRNTFLLPTYDDPEKDQAVQQQRRAKQWLELVKEMSGTYNLNREAVELALRRTCKGKDPASLELDRIRKGIVDIAEGVEGKLFDHYRAVLAKDEQAGGCND